MAEPVITEPNDTRIPPGDWRPSMAISAASEVCAIAGMLQRHDEPDPELLRGLAIRLEHLSEVVLSAIGDENASEEELSDQLLGPEVRRARLREAAR